MSRFYRPSAKTHDFVRRELACKAKKVAQAHHGNQPHNGKSGLCLTNFIFRKFTLENESMNICTFISIDISVVKLGGL